MTSLRTCLCGKQIIFMVKLLLVLYYLENKKEEKRGQDFLSQTVVIIQTIQTDGQDVCCLLLPISTFLQI